MARPTRTRSRRSAARGRASKSAEKDLVVAATMQAATQYWRWLGEEFPRYAKAVNRELASLKGRRVGAQEAVIRIARLGQEYIDALGDLPRRMLEQMDSTAGSGEARGRRRRQGRVID